MLLNIILAYLAGFISFCLSCLFPLIPIYLSYLLGENLNNKNIKKTLLISIFFSLGFFLSFMSFALIAFTFFQNLITMQQSQYFIGIVIITFGLIILLSETIWPSMLSGINGFSNLSSRTYTKVRSINSLIFGFVLGFTWSPCISPLLGSYITIASTSNNLNSGVLYLIIYAIGLVTPFILIALAYDRLKSTVKLTRKYAKSIKVSIAIVMILYGINFMYNIFNIHIYRFEEIEYDVINYIYEKFYDQNIYR